LEKERTGSANKPFPIWRRRLGAIKEPLFIFSFTANL